jgi:CubicO group peptidase (beta-lactamase class C family)
MVIRRRRFLGAAATLGLASWRGGVGRLLAQEPKKSKEAVVSPDPIASDERIDRALESVRTGGRRLPGMIGAIVRGEKLEAIGASGIRKIGSTEPIRPVDLIHLGSCSKAMTATMIGTLVDEGKLGWDRTIGDIFPDQASAIHPEFLRVTLRHLLSHRAGLPHDASWWKLGRGLPVTQQRRMVLTRMLQDPPRDRPGTKYDYSNVGYVLAGLMAEQVTGTPWEELMRRRLFGPLGMTSAGFGPPGKPGQVDQPWGHKGEGDELRPVREDNPPVMGPAGTIHCSVPGWARFASLHLRGTVGGQSPLKPETLKALHTPEPGEDYVGGWFVADRSWAGGQAFNHQGSNTTWYCSIWLAPVLDIGFLVATNAGSDQASKACDEAIGELIRIATPDRPRRR